MDWIFPNLNTRDILGGCLILSGHAVTQMVSTCCCKRVNTKCCQVKVSTAAFPIDTFGHFLIPSNYKACH